MWTSYAYDGFSRGSLRALISVVVLDHNEHALLRRAVEDSAVRKDVSGMRLQTEVHPNGRAIYYDYGSSHSSTAGYRSGVRCSEGDL
jgi:hypothetical protein